MFTRFRIFKNTHLLFSVICYLLASVDAAASDTLQTISTQNPDDTTVIQTSDQDSLLPEIDQMPSVLTRSAPAYPDSLKKKGIQGTVLLECVISDTGSVDSVAIVQGVHPVLDSNAIRSMRTFRFSPAVADSQNIAVLLQYEIPFLLSSVTDTINAVVNFSGKLRESGTRNPLADAVIAVQIIDTAKFTAHLSIPYSVYLDKIGTFPNQSREGNSIITQTDSLGNFSFFSLPACSIKVTAPIAGYEPFMQTESIITGEELNVTYYCKKTSYSDYEITVYGKAEEKEVVRRQLTSGEIKKMPGLGNDAIRVVQALPGVSRPSFGSGEVVVRGSPSWDSEFFLDGTVLPLLYHFGGLKSVYQSEAISSINFYPGGFSTRYGGAIAGVIEISGREAKKDRIHGIADVNLVDGSFFVEGPVNKKISFLASARRSFIGDIVSWYINKNPDQFPFSVSPFYYDVLARTDISLSKDNHCFVTFLGSRDSLGLFVPQAQGGSSEVSENTNELSTKIQFLTGLAGWDRKFDDRIRNELRYSFTDEQWNMSMFGYVKVNEHAYVHHLRDELTLTLTPSVSLSVGADANLIDENLILQIPSQSGIINKDTTNNWLFGTIGGYTNITCKLSDKLQIQTGLRYDYYPELKHDGAVIPEFWQYRLFDYNLGPSGEPSLRLSSRYKLDDKRVIKAALGSYNQSPEPLGQVIHKTWGDPYMPTTKASHYLAGYEHQLTDVISFDIQGYINRQWDIPRQAEEEDQKTNPGVLWLHDDKGKMKGIEMMLRHNDNGRFFGWVAYTLSQSSRWNPHTGKYYLYGEDETHHLQMIGSFHLSKDWDIGSRVRFISGKPSTPVAYVVEDEVNNTFIAFPGALNSERLDPFFQIDLRIDKKFVYKTWMLSTYLDFQNISWFFYKSPEAYQYSYDYKERKKISMVPLPALGIKAEF